MVRPVTVVTPLLQDNKDYIFAKMFIAKNIVVI